MVFEVHATLTQAVRPTLADAELSSVPKFSPEIVTGALPVGAEFGEFRSETTGESKVKPDSTLHPARSAMIDVV
jgi:hypothetical protein